MKKMNLVVMAVLACSQMAWPCTTVFVNRINGEVMANNFDFYTSHGRIFVNKAHVKKQSLTIKPGDRPLTWTSAYSSLTLNFVGQEFPNGGINEKGLAIEIMTLEESVFPQPDNRPSLNEVQWIQYMLDTAKSVEDVIRQSANVRVSDIAEPVHYLVCDVRGSCATFEYINGQLVVHQKKQMPVNVLTNDTYDNSVAYLKGFAGFGGSQPLPKEINSLNRFVIASTGVANIHWGTHNPVGDAFAVINSAKAPDTKWQVAYDMTRGGVFYRTASDVGTKYVQFSVFSRSCKDPVYSISMNDVRVGNITGDLVPITAKDNFHFVQETINTLQNIPAPLKPTLIPIIANYPQTTTCEE